MIEARSNDIDRRNIVGRKPFGNKISDAPLQQAIFRLAPIKGFHSQTELAQALGMKSNSAMSRILRGDANPSPATFSKLLIVLKPDDNEMESLVAPYSEALILKEKKKHELLSKNIKPSDNPVGQWIENWCNQKGVTITQFDELVNCQIGMGRRSFGSELLSRFIQNASTALDLSKKEKRSLNRAVEMEKKQRPLLNKNKNIRANVKKMQKEAGSGFTGGEAAKKLGVLRGTVGYWADELGMPLVLSEQDIAIIRLARLGSKALVRKKRDINFTEQNDTRVGSGTQEHVIFESTRLAS